MSQTPHQDDAEDATGVDVTDPAEETAAEERDARVEGTGSSEDSAGADDSADPPTPTDHVSESSDPNETSQPSVFTGVDTDDADEADGLDADDTRADDADADDTAEIAPITAPTIQGVRATGAIPIVGDAMPVTGAVPVIRPIYPPKSRTPWIVTTIVLFLLLAGSVYLGWRLWTVNGEWQDYSDQLTQANYDLGEQIAAEQLIVTQKENEVALLSEQLSASNSRLLDVSAEKADALDNDAWNQQIVEQQGNQLSLGQAATASLNSCIDGLENLVEYVSAPEDEYDADQVQDYADGVVELCAAADTATQNFQNAFTP